MSCASTIKPGKEANSNVQTINLPANADRVAKHASRDTDEIFSNEILLTTSPIPLGRATQLTG